MRTDKEILDELRRMSAGLLMMSESDYPFEVFKWDGQIEVNPRFLRTLTTETDETEIAEMPVEQLLAMGTYERLAKSLRDNLTDLKVYKVGTRSIPVYIIGKSPEGNWLGLSTRIVQT